MAVKGYVSNVDVRSDNYNLKDMQARAHIQDKNNPHNVSVTQIGLDESYKTTTPKDIQENTITALLNKLAVDYSLSKTTIANLRQQIQDILESPTMDVSHKLDKFEEGQTVEKSVEFEEGISIKDNQIMYDSESQNVEFGVDIEQKPIQNWNFNGTLMQNDIPVITSISATSQTIESSGNATVLVERGEDGVVNFRFLIPKGPAGQGLPGDKGDPGVTYYPTVTDGYLSWDIYDPEVHATYPETVDIRGAYFKPYLRVEYIYKKDEAGNNILDENDEPIIESTKYYLCWDNNKGLVNPDDMELPIPKAPAQYYPTMEIKEDEKNITSFTVGWKNDEGLNNPDPVTISLPNKKLYYTKEEMDEKLEQSSLSSGNITGKRLLIWKGELTTSDFNNVNNYITLSKDMTEFDEIIIVASFNYNGAVSNLFGDATSASTNTDISWSHPISKEILDGQPFSSSFYTYSNAGVQICCEFTGVDILHFKHVQQTWHTKTTIKEVYGVKYQYLEGTNTRVLFDEKVTYIGNGEFNETPTIIEFADIPSVIHLYAEEENGKRFATLYKGENECIGTFVDNDNNITTYPLRVLWNTDDYLSVKLYSNNSAEEQFNIADKEYNFIYYYRKFIDNIIAEAGAASGFASVLGELSDVELNELSNNQILVYDAKNEKWVNKDNIAELLPGGSGGRIEQTLYINSTTSAQSIELSDSYKNYDLLMFRMIRIADGVDNFQEEKYFDKDWLEQCQNSNSRIQFFGYTQWNTYQITDETHFTLTNTASGVYVREVVGVKFSSSGWNGNSGEVLYHQERIPTNSNAYTINFDKKPSSWIRVSSFGQNENNHNYAWFLVGDQACNFVWSNGSSYSNRKATLTWAEDMMSVAVVGYDASGCSNAGTTVPMMLDYYIKEEIINGVGSSYSETVLYDYREDNGGVICYDTTPQTLRDDIENYDLLFLEFASVSGDLTNASWSATCETVLNVDLLTNGYNPNYINYTSFGDRSSRCYIKGREFTTTTRNHGSTNGLVRMVGIKFAISGGGSGGSQVEVSAIQTEGAHIANITINGKTTEIYAPEGGELGSLADIEITNPSAKQTLIYDDKKKKWINVSLNESKEVKVALPKILQTEVNVTSFTLTEDNVYVFISFNASSGCSPTNGYNSIVSSTMEKIYFERNISVGDAERGSAAFGVFKGNTGDTLQINAQACCTKLIKTNEEFNIIGHDIANTPSDVAYIVKEYNKDTLDTNNHRYYVAMVSCSGNGGQTCSITCEDGKRTELIQQANGGSGYCLLDSFLVEKDTLHNIHLYAKSTTNNTSFPKAAGYFIGYFRCNDKKDENIQGGGISALPNNLLYMSEDSEDINFGLNNDYSYNVYSLDEKVIGKWVDGKKIYRKVCAMKPSDVDLIISQKEVGTLSQYDYNKGLIPILTSNTGTNGTTIKSDYTSPYDAWRMFNNDRTTNEDCWYKNSKPCWVGYHFNEPKIVKSFMIRQEHSTPEYFRTFTFQASNDGSTWIDLGTYTAECVSGKEFGFAVDNKDEYSYYRWYFNDGPNTGITIQLAQMYDYNIVYNIWEYTKTTDLKDI